MQRLTFGIMHCDYRAVGLTGDIERCDGPNRAKGVDVVADIPRRVPPGIHHQEPWARSCDSARTPTTSSSARSGQMRPPRSRAQRLRRPHPPPGPSPSRASRNSSANPPHSRPGDRSARPNHELHLRIDYRAMRFKSRSRRISVWNSTAPRWARKVMNRRYARSVCAWRNTA